MWRTRPLIRGSILTLAAELAPISTCYCNPLAPYLMCGSIVKTLSGMYTPLLQFIMTQQWLSLGPPIPPARSLPGYGNINPADPGAAPPLVPPHTAAPLVFSQTRYHPPKHGHGRDPFRLPGDRRRLRGSGRRSEGVGARRDRRRDRESQTRRYLRE